MTMDIAKIDKNFANFFSFEGLKTYDINEAPFRLYGLSREPGETDFKRLPHSLGKTIDNSNVNVLYMHTSGIRLRFKTNSQRIVISYILPTVNDMDHMPRTGRSCFDMYADGKYCNVLRVGTNVSDKKPAAEEIENSFSSGFNFPDRKERDILINFPLYNGVTKVYISLEEEASVAAPTPYGVEKPIVFYGSSITQGGCASHPGNCYSHIISRRLDADFINVGFSGGCKAEMEFAEYFGNLPMSIFVYDYDHNAPTAEFLQNTHEPFFKRFRELQPETPVVMISSANVMKDHQLRKGTIRTTYENARAAGDKNVWFIDGDTIYQNVGKDYCTVDGCHPNDLGFWCMANSIGAVLEKIVKEKGL